MKKHMFLDVNDGSTFQSLQIVLPTADTPETYSSTNCAHYSVTVGSSVRVTGAVTASTGTQDIELHAPTATVLGISPEDPNVPLIKRSN